MTDELLNRAAVQLRESAHEAAEALRLLQQFEEKATYVCDAFAQLDENGRECISRIQDTVEQLYVLSERVLSIDVKIRPCPLHRAD